MKIALISHVVPPSWSGTAMVIYRMFRDLNPESYCLISSQASGIEGDKTEYQQALLGRCYQTPAEFNVPRGHRFGARYLNLPISVLHRARYIAGIIKREQCDVVVACTGDVLDLPAGYVASRLAHAPFYAYIFDHYSKREWVDPIARAWAKWLEPWLIRGADGLIAPNETLRDDLFDDYGVEATVIHNSCDIAAYETSSVRVPGATNGEIAITYTGDVYEAHYDAFRNLLAALKILDRYDIKLHLYTARAAEALQNSGIHGPIIRHAHRDPSEIPATQLQADILFLPLAFDSPYPDVIKTSSTSKVGEYLAARRPVLVHAPPDSFVSSYFRQHECGVVVDQLDPNLMSQAIERILLDTELQQRLATRAWERARADFDIQIARKKFLNLLEKNVDLSF